MLCIKSIIEPNTNLSRQMHIEGLYQNTYKHIYACGKCELDQKNWTEFIK